MGAIDNFLRRFGFAKLDRYGLILTPDDRVISMRSTVLDDGLGGKIVGWREGDLAAMELDHWGAKKPATAKPIAAPASLHKLPPAPAARIVAPAAPIAPAAPAIPAPALVAAPVVAAAEEPGEDEWEWEIAMARARAAEVEEARVDLLGAQAVIASAVFQRKTNPGMAVVAAKSRDRAPPLPDPLPPWPETEPFNEAWSERSEVAPQVMSVLQKKLAVERSTPARGAATVIPVPQLPAAADPRTVRPAPYTPMQPRGRIARGTATQGQPLEETVRTQAAPPVHDDRTSPYIELPPEVKPSGFAHTKRVAAKQR